MRIPENPPEGRPTLRRWVGPSRHALAVAMLAAALLMVLAARERLIDPATHAAIARALGDSPPALVVAPPDGVEAKPASVLPPAELSAIEDNAPFRDAEQPAWFALLAEARDKRIDSTTARRVGYAALSSQPDVYRATPIVVVGKVHRVERVGPAKNKERIGVLWRVILQGDGADVWPITLYTLDEPPAADSPYEAHAVGFFFKKLSYRHSGGVGVSPVVVARRVAIGAPAAPRAEYANAPSDPAPAEQERRFEQPSAGSLGRAMLADLGVDLAVLDAVADKRPLLAAERDPFYATLAAVSQTPATQLARLARSGLASWAQERERRAGESPRDRPMLAAVERSAAEGAFSVVPLFVDGLATRGDLVAFDASVRRVVRIEVDPPALGVDHYYELEAFTADSQGLPLVFCVRDLPAGFPIGDDVRQPARLAGFFFKHWAYRTRLAKEDGGDAARFAPLLIGRAPIVLPDPAPRDGRIDVLVGVTAAACIAAVAVWLWCAARSDAAYSAGTLDRFRGAARGVPPAESALAPAIEAPPR
ncbi:MAG: hypothetical protein ACRCT8_11055 [Lacipirellulaceae bacterium]